LRSAHAAPEVGDPEVRIDRDGRLGYLMEAVKIMRIHGDFSEPSLRFETPGIEFDGIAEDLLGECHIAFGASGAAEPELYHEASKTNRGISLGSLSRPSTR
jgi:hypothetical protein